MLYIVGTPIGNLEDLSYRQAKTLAEAKIIVTEDTRSTGILLQKIPELFPFELSPEHRLISYYKENEFEKLPEIVELLKRGQDIVLISQAGMPLISDPGYLLVKTVIKEDLPFTVIPGPTAAITALIASSFPPETHMFLGFFPKTTPGVRKSLVKLKKVKEVLNDAVFIFYESPNRIHETLKTIAAVWPEVHVSISRELTKKFEQTVRGTAQELANKPFKGELTVVLF